MNECGRLVWDYATGDVICADNGVVVDRIYDYGPVYESCEVRERARADARKRFKRYGRRAEKKLRQLRRSLRRHYRILRLAKSISSKGYIIDYDKLFHRERFVFTVYSKRTVEALEWFRRRGLLPVLDRIISVLSDLEPGAFSRTIRGRYMLAYMVYEMIRGRDPSYSQLDGLRILVSDNTFRRLKKVARTLVVKHRELLEEAVGNE